MRKLYLFGFIVLLNFITLDKAVAQSGRQRQTIPVSPVTVLEPNVEQPQRTERPPLPIMRRVSPAMTAGSGKVPDYIVYGTVFRLAKTGWTGEELKFNPFETRICKKYRREKILNENQDKFLKSVAEETQFELDKLAQKAKLLIEDFRAKRLSGSPGQQGGRPTPPPELEALSKQKITLIEEAIERLKTNFGEQDFAKFSRFVDENIRSSYKTGNVPIP